MAETITSDVLLAWKMLEDDLFDTDDKSASEEEKNLRLLANTDLGDEPKETFEQMFNRISEEIYRGGWGDHSSTKVYVTQEALDDLTDDLEK